MTTNLITFSFQEKQVRIVWIDDEPHWVGKDVCEALGYKDHISAMRSHCKGVLKSHPLMTDGGMQEFRVLSEADVLRLIVSSTLPQAVEFERKVFEEVLPTIRKTGGYGTLPPPPPNVMSINGIPVNVPDGRAFSVTLLKTGVLTVRVRDSKPESPAPKPAPASAKAENPPVVAPKVPKDRWCTGYITLDTQRHDVAWNTVAFMQREGKDKEYPLDVLWYASKACDIIDFKTEYMQLLNTLQLGGIIAISAETGFSQLSIFGKVATKDRLLCDRNERRKWR
jgi:hypothetical protein